LKRLNNYYQANLFYNIQIFNKELILNYERLTSDGEIAAILSQGKIENDLPIAYASRTINKAERNYDTQKRNS